MYFNNIFTQLFPDDCVNNLLFCWKYFPLNMFRRFLVFFVICEAIFVLCIYFYERFFFFDEQQRTIMKNQNFIKSKVYNFSPFFFLFDPFVYYFDLIIIFFIYIFGFREMKPIKSNCFKLTQTQHRPMSSTVNTLLKKKTKQKQKFAEWKSVLAISRRPQFSLTYERIYYVDS